MDVIDRCDFNPGDSIKGYRIVRILGEGSFGKVFQVNDSSGQVYALKVLKLWAIPPEIRKKLIARFEMEFETGRIGSNYLVHSITCGYNGQIPFIVMEYCANGNLLQLLKTNRQTDLAGIAKDILYGLKDLHRYGKVHRDLKPENVLIKTDGTAALTDFGIAGDRNKRLTERKTWGSPTQIFGTYAYMPPEQVSGSREATVLPTTDIFSFGVMMYFVLTGYLPFGRLNSEDDLAGYIKNGREGNWDKTVLNRDANAKLFYPAISGCLTSDFKKRLQTVDEVLKLIPAATVNRSYKPLINDVNVQSKVVNGLLLRIMQGEEYQKTYKLNDLLQGKGRIITLGRYDDGVTSNHIPLVEDEGNYISRKHCTLELDYATRNWYIRDGQWDRNSNGGWKRSLNGTFVNSAEATADGIPVFPGDIVSIGDIKLRVEGY
jgi:serine/threonine protein kinase